eukprot:6468683-Amphidinium_carterae.1
MPVATGRVRRTLASITDSGSTVQAKRCSQAQIPSSWSACIELAEACYNVHHVCTSILARSNSNTITSLYTQTTMLLWMNITVESKSSSLHHAHTRPSAAQLLECTRFLAPPDTTFAPEASTSLEVHSYSDFKKGCNENIQEVYYTLKTMLSLGRVDQKRTCRVWCTKISTHYGRPEMACQNLSLLGHACILFLRGSKKGKCESTTCIFLWLFGPG